MINDYEQLKQDLSFNINQNADLKHNLDINVSGRRRAEDDLLRVTKDYETLKMESADARAADSREIVANQSKVRELRDRLELVEAENR